MEWFKNRPERPKMPVHLDESVLRQGGLHGYPIASLPALVEPRLRPEAEEYVGRFDDWRSRVKEWEKAQPISRSETGLSVRLFGGPWILSIGDHFDALRAYKALAKAGADEKALRYEAGLIYDDVRMRDELSARAKEGAQRMREAAKRLRGR